MNRYSWKLSALVALVALGCFGCVRTEQENAAPSTEARGEDPSPAPDFSIETFDGQRFRLSEQRGQPVVLNFWESW